MRGNSVFALPLLALAGIKLNPTVHRCSPQGVDLHLMLLLTPIGSLVPLSTGSTGSKKKGLHFPNVFFGLLPNWILEKNQIKLGKVKFGVSGYSVVQ